MKFEVGDDFSKILFGDDISREIVPNGRFLRRNHHLAVWGQFLQGMIYAGDNFSSIQAIVYSRKVSFFS